MNISGIYLILRDKYANASLEIAPFVWDIHRQNNFATTWCFSCDFPTL